MVSNYNTDKLSSLAIGVNPEFITIRYVIFEKEVGPPNFPLALVIEMDSNYNGPSIDGLPNHIALNPISSHCDTLE
jgi:hypothetical protein